MISAGYEIERLLLYGLRQRLIDKWDIVPVRNALMELLQVNEPFEGPVAAYEGEYPAEILNKLLDYCFETGVMEENTVTYRDLLDTKIMGMLMPRQSEVVKRFYDTVSNQSVEMATDAYYHLSKSSNYIRMDRIEKNLYWRTPSQYGDIEITVNLSKPEKDPRAIAAARNLKQSNYPKCLLCVENAGYQGRLNHPARQNHRVIPLKLNEEQWYLQYSPYVYYNEHCIVFCEEHRPMKMSEDTFVRLLDYVEQFPHYFIGSNADLPIVGGSILSHDHFQGGRHRFPMELAAVEMEYRHGAFPGVKAGIVKWPMSVVRISGKYKEELVNAAMHIFDQWREYSDSDSEILSYSREAGERIPHNTVTPIARINADHEFELDLVLRNNRTSEQHPYGIFHPHEELHHIKKENIGLIEVMGLAVLPGRLDEEIKAMEDILSGERDFDEEGLREDELLGKHIPWLTTIIGRYGIRNGREQAGKIMQNEIGSVFVKVLEDSGVYKRTESGMKGFEKFMQYIGLSEV